MAAAKPKSSSGSAKPKPSSGGGGGGGSDMLGGVIATVGGAVAGLLGLGMGAAALAVL